MTSKWIHNKIQKTRLFSDAQKVELLVELEHASEADVQKLEAGIDAFDAAYAKAVAKHGAQIHSVLGHAVKDMDEEEKKKNSEAIEEIKLGLAFLTPTT
jgi:hypothetical protein